MDSGLKKIQCYICNREGAYCQFGLVFVVGNGIFVKGSVVVVDVCLLCASII